MWSTLHALLLNTSNILFRIPIRTQREPDSVSEKTIWSDNLPRTFWGKLNHSTKNAQNTDIFSEHQTKKLKNCTHYLPLIPLKQQWSREQNAGGASQISRPQQVWSDNNSTAQFNSRIKRKNSPSAVTSLDAGKAFDRVNWQFLLSPLKQRGIAPAFFTTDENSVWFHLFSVH